MKPASHIIVSLSTGALVWFFAKSLYAGIVCFFAGLFVDVDHIIEYIIHYGGKNFTYNNLYLTCEQTSRQEGDYQFRKLHLIFHSIEIIFALWVITIYTRNIYLFAVVIGYSAHLILDWIGNPIYLHSYFIIWRAKNKFHTNRLLRKKSCKKSK